MIANDSNQSLTEQIDWVLCFSRAGLLEIAHRPG
jgi:hypothetical protein